MAEYIVPVQYSCAPVSIHPLFGATSSTGTRTSTGTRARARARTRTIYPYSPKSQNRPGRQHPYDFIPCSSSPIAVGATQFNGDGKRRLPTGSRQKSALQAAGWLRWRSGRPHLQPPRVRGRAEGECRAPQCFGIRCSTEVRPPFPSGPE